jgi:integrase
MPRETPRAEPPGPPRLPGRPSPSSLSWSAALAAIKGEPLEALWVLALTTGLRRGEQLALRWRDLDLEARTYRVTATLQRVGGELRVLPTKTPASRASGHLAALAAQALTEHRARQLAAGLVALPGAIVFTSSSGRSLEPRNVNRSFDRLLRRHGLKHIRLHDLRHSIGSLMLANGESPRVVMEVLRHSQIAMTMNVYSHVMPALTRDAIDRLNTLLTSSGEA